MALWAALFSTPFQLCCMLLLFISQVLPLTSVNCNKQALHTTRKLNNETTGNQTMRCLEVMERERFIFEPRQESTSFFLAGKNSFRLVTYNILYDVFSRKMKNGAKRYDYCPRHALTMEYRLPTIRKELQGYHADILSLQEVEQFVFNDHLSELKINYGSTYCNRANRTMGLALFFNKQKFKLISSEREFLKKLLEVDDANQPVAKLAFHNHVFKRRLLRHDAVVLLVVVQSVEDPSHYIIVVNTHLHAPVNADHARIVQTAVIINFLQRKLLELRKTLNQSSIVSYVFSGDFNAPPRTAVVDYILSGKVAPNHKDWFSAGLKEFHGTNITLSHSLPFSLSSDYHTYSFHAEDYIDCVDYIFVSPNTVKVDKVLKAPSHELVTKYTSMPSVIAPSDHIAQVVDLSLIRPGNDNQET